MTRVILAATSFAEARAAMALAAEVATAQQAEITGLLIEDDDHFALADAPGMVLLSDAGQPLAGITAARMNAACRHDATRFRAHLERTVAGLALSWTFSTERGDLPAVVGLRARSGDWLVLGGEPAQSPHREVVLIADSAPDEVLDNLARRIASRAPNPLRVIGPPGMGAVDDAITERIGDAEKLRRRLCGLRADCIVIARERLDDASLMHALRLARCTRIFLT